MMDAAELVRLSHSVYQDYLERGVFNRQDAIYLTGQVLIASAIERLADAKAAPTEDEDPFYGHNWMSEAKSQEEAKDPSS